MPGGGTVARIAIRDVRSNLRTLIERAEAGEEIVILRRGKAVARLLPPEREAKPFPDLTAFRESIALKGEPLSETVIHERRAARF
jgi:prevent-host-death family protein